MYCIHIIMCRKLKQWFNWELKKKGKSKNYQDVREYEKKDESGD
jgi:hypothetical protein